MEALKPLTNKEIRYAMIKGIAEKKDYRKKPPPCWPLYVLGLTNQYIDGTLKQSRYYALTAGVEEVYGVCLYGSYGEEQ